MHHHLIIPLGLLFVLQVHGSGEATSERRLTTVISPMHPHLEASSPTGEPEDQEDILPSSEGSRKSSLQKRSITTNKPKATVDIYSWTDDPTPQESSPLSPQQMNDAILEIMATLESVSENETQETSTLKTLSETVERLSKKSEQHETATSKISDGLSNVVSVVDGLKESETARKQTLTKKIGDVQKSIIGLETNTRSAVRKVDSSLGKVITNFSHPRAFLNVDKIKGLVEKAKTSEVGRFDSDYFVIDGYTAQFSVQAKLIDKKMWLGVYFHLCPGPKDSILQWPFRIDYTLSIFHTNDPARDVNRQLTVYPYGSCPRAFDKPKSECNQGCGFAKMLAWDSAQEQGYVYGDKITVGMTLRKELSS